MTSQWWSQHGAHVILLGAPVLVVAAIGVGADVRAWMRRHPRDLSLLPAATLSTACAVVHGLVCPEHFAEGFVYGAFFATTSALQLGWAALAATRARPWLARAAVAANSAMVMLWAVTRTVGIPLGPERGEVETPGTLDIVATSCELALVAVCVLWLLRARSRQLSAPATA